jgi:hypothetical protein
MPRELYPFRYRDRLTGKWVRARYVAELHEIAERYAEWEITGPPEIRSRGESGSFNPYRRLPDAHLPPVEEPPPEKEPPEREPPDNEPPEPPIEEPPIEDALERFLVLYFLRRYVTWCVRRRHFDSAKRAAMLWRGINAPGSAR